jgi:hypothetical protein
VDEHAPTYLRMLDGCTSSLQHDKCMACLCSITAPLYMLLDTLLLPRPLQLWHSVTNYEMAPRIGAHLGIVQQLHHAAVHATTTVYVGVACVVLAMGEESPPLQMLYAAPIMHCSIVKWLACLSNYLCWHVVSRL